MTGRSLLIVATCSVVDVLSQGVLLMIAFLQIKMAGWRLQSVVARNLAITGAVAFLNLEKYLVVPRLSVRAACRNHKGQMFVSKARIPITLEGYTTRRRLE